MIKVESTEQHLIEVRRETTWENDGSPGLCVTIKTGYRLREMIDIMESYTPIMERLKREQELRDKYPALQNAHEHYCSILAMCESATSD